jgi:Plavaka transposase
VSFQFEGSKGVEKEKKFPTVPAETSSTSDIAISSATSNLVPDFIQPEPEPIPSPVPPSALALTVSGRPHRQRKLPQKLRDLLPEPPAPASPPSVPDAKPVRRVLLIVRDRLVTAANSFGIWRDYPRRPTADPDAFLSLKDLSNAHGCSMNPNPLPNLSNQSAPPVDSDRPFHWPFSNPTIWRVMSWLNNGKTAKSEAEVTDFIHNAVLSRDFNKDDLKGFNAHRENQRLDKTLSKASLQAHFSESSVDILVPSGNTAIPPKIFTIPGLLHRKLTSVICDAFQDPLAHLLHYSPFKLFHRNPVTKEEERLYGELYTSDAFHDEHENLQRHGKLPLDDLDCKREKVIAALMVSSDATHLTDFGNAKAWPIYLMLGNLSKYLRSLPNSGAIHHLAYIPSVSVTQSLLSYPNPIYVLQLSAT